VEFVSLIESQSTRSWRATRPREMTLASSLSERSEDGLFLQVEQNDYGSEGCVFESRRVHCSLSMTYALNQASVSIAAWTLLEHFLISSVQVVDSICFKLSVSRYHPGTM
jgi:hypothetical protein